MKLYKYFQRGLFFGFFFVLVCGLWFVLFCFPVRLYTNQTALALYIVLDVQGSMCIFAEFRPEPFWSLTIKKNQKFIRLSTQFPIVTDQGY